jgi:hypothetical protein
MTPKPPKFHAKDKRVCCRSRWLASGILRLCKATSSSPTESYCASASRSTCRSRISTAASPLYSIGTSCISKRRRFTARRASPRSTPTSSLNCYWSADWKTWSVTAGSSSIVACGSTSSIFSATKSTKTCPGTPPKAALASSIRLLCSSTSLTTSLPSAWPPSWSRAIRRRWTRLRSKPTPPWTACAKSMLDRCTPRS